MIKPAQRAIYAVIGDPVGHSLSPVMMNRAFQEESCPACYLAFQANDTVADLQLLHQVGISGLSVTIPHKEAALRICEQVDATAKTIGAVNTLQRTVSGWQGCNTDWLGVVRALQQKARLESRNMLVVGAGGAARAVVYGLLKAGCRVTITNRSPDKALRMAEEFHCRFVALGEVMGQRYDGLVHCTPVGMVGNEERLLVPKEIFAPGMLVMDAVYRPLWTPLLKCAADAGCITVTGLEMLLYQGAAQFEWWWKKKAPVAAMKRALEDALKGEDHA